MSPSHQIATLENVTSGGISNVPNVANSSAKYTDYIWLMNTDAQTNPRVTSGLANPNEVAGDLVTRDKQIVVCRMAFFLKTLFSSKNFPPECSWR